jgi:hypothetical protein
MRPEMRLKLLAKNRPRARHKPSFGFEGTNGKMIRVIPTREKPIVVSTQCLNDATFGTRIDKQ